MDFTTIITVVGTVWAIGFGIFTYLKKSEAKKPTVSRLASPEQVWAWQQDREEKIIKQAALKKGFRGFIAFILFILKAVTLSFLFGGSSDTSTASSSGESGSDKATKKRDKISDKIYDKIFPTNPDITINLFLVVLILISFPILLGFWNVSNEWKIAIYTMSACSTFTFLFKITQKWIYAQLEKVYIRVNEPLHNLFLVLTRPIRYLIGIILDIFEKNIVARISANWRFKYTLPEMLLRLGQYFLGAIVGTVIGFFIAIFAEGILITRWGWLIVGTISGISYTGSNSYYSEKRPPVYRKIFRNLFWCIIGTTIAAIFANLFGLSKNGSETIAIVFIVIGGALGLLVAKIKNEISIEKKYAWDLYDEGNVQELVRRATKGDNRWNRASSVKEYLMKLDDNYLLEKLASLLKSIFRDNRESAASYLLMLPKCIGIRTINNTLLGLKNKKRKLYSIIRTLLKQVKIDGPKECNVQLFSFILKLDESDSYIDFVTKELFENITPEFNMILRQAQSSTPLQILILITSQFLNRKMNTQDLTKYLAQEKLSNDGTSLIRIILKHADDESIKTIKDSVKKYQENSICVKLSI